MPVESLEYDEHGQPHSLDEAKKALYGQLLCLDGQLVNLLDITSQNCDLNPNELTIIMHIDPAEAGLLLNDMTCDNRLVITLTVQIRVKIDQAVRGFSFGTVEDAAIRTIYIGHEKLQLALQALHFEDRATIVNRTSNVMQENWACRLEQQKRFDLMDHFMSSINDFRWNMLHALVEE